VTAVNAPGADRISRITLFRASPAVRLGNVIGCAGQPIPQPQRDRNNWLSFVMALRARLLSSFPGRGASTGQLTAANNCLLSAPVGTCVLLLFAFAHVTVAEDADVHDLQENLPVRVTDAFASSGPQVQARTLLSGERPRGFQAQLEPQVQWGFAPRWHVQAAAVIVTSSRGEHE
jgi:hypothetical protein